MALSVQQIAAVTAAISPTRMGTYVNAMGFGPGATALDIYVWNALVSCAFFSALHICEVVIRNAAAHALELKYGANLLKLRCDHTEAWMSEWEMVSALLAARP